MRYVLCLCLAFTLSTQVTAQQSPSLDSKVSAILARMNSDDLHAREAAFDDMMDLIREGQNRATESGYSEVLARFFKQHPEQAERIKLGLIHLLNTDNILFTDKNTAPGTYTEDDTEHYAETVDVVSSLNDERAIPALAGAIATGGMAQRGILKFGDQAVGPLMQQLKSSDALVRASTLELSIALLERRGDPVSHAQIRELIRSSLSDPASVVRRTAVQQIGCLDDRQNFVPVLKEIAKTDPLKLPGKALDGGDGDEFYPVRADARAVLRDIQDNKTCVP